LGVDLRHHGQYPTFRNEHNHDDDDMSHIGLARDVIEWMNDLGLAQVVLIGHSMGGKVSMALAVTWPDRVAGLMILDTAPVSYQGTPHWQTIAHVVRVLQNHAAATQAVALTRTKRQVDQELRAELPDAALRAFCLTNWHNGQWTIPLDILATQLDAIANFDVPFQQYTGPVLLVHGQKSRFVTAAYLPAVASYFPNHVTVTVRGAGHWIHAEAPDDVVALCMQYLSAL
jgi:esterase